MLSLEDFRDALITKHKWKLDEYPAVIEDEVADKYLEYLDCLLKKFGLAGIKELTGHRTAYLQGRKQGRAAGLLKHLTELQKALGNHQPNSLDQDSVAGKKLKGLKGDASKVTEEIEVKNTTVYVQLDRDQNKHQPPEIPIGDREKAGGNRFNTTATPEWHKTKTMQYMAEWAESLGAMQEGQVKQHGQAKAVDGIHYEAFCLFANGKKYVSFHCYPADNSEFRWGGAQEKKVMEPKKKK